MAKRGNTMINITAMEADGDGDDNIIVSVAHSDDGDVYIETAKESDDIGHPVHGVKKRHAFHIDVVQLLNAFVDVGVLANYELPTPPPAKK